MSEILKLCCFKRKRELGERSVVSEQARAGTWLTMVVGERTQAVVVESLQTCPQTTLCPSCLLVDTGSGRVGVTVLSVRFSVNLDERRKE